MYHSLHALQALDLSTCSNTPAGTGLIRQMNYMTNLQQLRTLLLPLNYCIDQQCPQLLVSLQRSVQLQQLEATVAAPSSALHMLMYCLQDHKVCRAWLL